VPSTWTVPDADQTPRSIAAAQESFCLSAPGIAAAHAKMDENAEALDFVQQFLKKSPPDDPNRALACEVCVGQQSASATSETPP